MTEPVKERLKGLSPRLRGNVLSDHPVFICDGSIPALAGERFGLTRKEMHKAVYPRACGGTLLDSRWSNPRRGLSPRLRGNA